MEISKKPLVLLFGVSLAIGAVQAGHALPNNTLFQVSTPLSLLQGALDGNYTVKQLEKKGNFGLGTFNGAAGELIAINGKFYDINAKGKARLAKSWEKTPFSTVTNFKPTKTFDVADVANIQGLKYVIEDQITNKNIPYAIKITGTFKQQSLRSLIPQKKPYRPITNTAKIKQNLFDLKNVQGTMVGFWFPEYLGNVNVPGFHFHFINKKHTEGGHVLNTEISTAKVSIEPIYNLSFKFPNSTGFKNANFNGNNKALLAKMEEIPTAHVGEDEIIKVKKR